MAKQIGTNSDLKPMPDAENEGVKGPGIDNITPFWSSRRSDPPTATRPMAGLANNGGGSISKQPAAGNDGQVPESFVGMRTGDPDGEIPSPLWSSGTSKAPQWSAPTPGESGPADGPIEGGMWDSAPSKPNTGIEGGSINGQSTLRGLNDTKI